MQRRWITAFIVASGLLAQTPPAAPAPQAPEPAPAPAPVPAPSPAPAPAPAPSVEPAAPAQEAKVAAPEALPFDQWRPTQRKYAYALERAALAAHELGYYRSHPRALEVRNALEALLRTKDTLPEKAKAGLAPVETYLGKLYAAHGLYDADGHKLLMEGRWKDLQATAHAAAKAAAHTPSAAEARSLEGRLARLRGLLFEAKVDAAAPTWAAPETGKKGRKAKAPKAPEGFREQKAVVASWVKQAMHYVPDTPQVVDVKGEKKTRLLPEPGQTKTLAGLTEWLDRDDLDLLRDPGFGWLDLRRLAALPGADQGRLGLGLLAKAGDITSSKAPEGAPAALPLLPVLQPVMGESKFSKGDEKRAIVADVKLLPAPASMADQMAAFEAQGRSREADVK